MLLIRRRLHGDLGAVLRRPVEQLGQRLVLALVQLVLPACVHLCVLANWVRCQTRLRLDRELGRVIARVCERLQASLSILCLLDRH